MKGPRQAYGPATHESVRAPQATIKELLHEFRCQLATALQNDTTRL